MGFTSWNAVLLLIIGKFTWRLYIFIDSELSLVIDYLPCQNKCFVFRLYSQVTQTTCMVLSWAELHQSNSQRRYRKIAFRKFENGGKTRRISMTHYEHIIPNYICRFYTDINTAMNGNK